MKVLTTALAGVLIIEPTKFSDDRGYFFESFNQREFEATTGLKKTFVQDNQSLSKRNVLRGLHYQLRQPQGKLTRVVSGEVFDVAVDLRRSSATFGRWVGVELSHYNCRQLWVPEGFAHGFLVKSETAEVIYKTTTYYAPADERTILWNDPTLAIDWPASSSKSLSPRDLAGTPFTAAEVYP